MHAFLHPIRHGFPALLLGLAAAVAVMLPPLDLGLRFDRALLDTWSRFAPMQAPQDLLLVELGSADWMTTLVSLTEQHGSQALLTTVPEPPSPRVNAHALGPMQLPLGNRLLRRTAWLHGGHLWFRAEHDGRVRHDWTVIDDTAPIPSLAVSA
jgi:hypothetical protein